MLLVIYFSIHKDHIRDFTRYSSDVIFQVLLTNSVIVCHVTRLLSKWFRRSSMFEFSTTTAYIARITDYYWACHLNLCRCVNMKSRPVYDIRIFQTWLNLTIRCTRNRRLPFVEHQTHALIMETC